MILRLIEFIVKRHLSTSRYSIEEKASKDTNVRMPLFPFQSLQQPALYKM